MRNKDLYYAPIRAKNYRIIFISKEENYELQLENKKNKNSRKTFTFILHLKQG